MIDAAATEGSTRTLLQIRPTNSQGLPIDATTIMDDDLTPMIGIQFCKCGLNEPVHTVLTFDLQLLRCTAPACCAIRHTGWREEIHISWMLSSRPSCKIH